MHVTLIHPPTIATVTTFAQEAVPPLGLAYICAALRANGIATTVVDAVGEALEQHVVYSREHRSMLRGLRFDQVIKRVPAETSVIGISCMFSNAWCPTRDLIVALKRAFPRTQIVLGGEHASACWEYILKSCDAVDACVLGEGEETVCELVHAIEESRGLDTVSGIAFRRDGVPVQTVRRPRIRSIDRISEPDWESFPIEQYIAGHYNHGVHRGRTMPILASRGCPYQCTFCSSPAMWTTKWTARNPRDVVNEMKRYIARYDVNDFAFYDLTAIIKRSWIIEFCELLIAEGINVTWQLPSGTRTEALDGEACKLLYASGCRNMNYAPESGSSRMLKRIKKRVNIDRMIESMRGAIGAGIDVKTNIIVGFPDESFDDVLDTFRFMARLAMLGAEAVSIFPFCPYPGSEIHRELMQRGRVALDDAYFNDLVYTDIGRVVSYNDRWSSRELKWLVLAGNAVFFGTQFVTHPMRFVDIAKQMVTREQGSKLTNAIEPMRRRKEAFDRIEQQFG